MPTPILIIVYIFLAVLFAVGLINVVAPRWCWKTFESWKAVSEPSKAYLLPVESSVLFKCWLLF